MNFYKNILRSFLFKFSPEQAHALIFRILKFPFCPYFLKIFFHGKKFDTKFVSGDFELKNRIGLAAGLDKDGEVLSGLSALGFGFVEIGTVTPEAQPGNPAPRLFRLVSDEALINRMGFNNLGAMSMKKRLEKLQSVDLTLGINLGKNKSTPLSEAHLDYLASFKILFDFADYFVINVSSPNTPNLRELQNADYLEKILSVLQTYNFSCQKSKPLFLKISPDVSNAQIDEIIFLAEKYNLKGLIATNTTVGRSNLSLSADAVSAIGSGGLSGLPLRQRSTEVIRYIKSQSTNLLVIGVGGVSSCADVLSKIDAGADLVQIYTSFIYEGPSIVKRLKKCIFDSSI